MGLAVVLEAGLDHGVGGGPGGGERLRVGREAALVDEVARQQVVHAGLVGVSGDTRIDRHRQRLIVDQHRGGGVLGRRPVLGQDDGDGVTHEPDLADRQSFHFRGHEPIDGWRDAQRAGAGANVGAAEGGDHVRQGHRRAKVDGADAGVRVRAADESRVQQSGQSEVVDEAANAEQQAPILKAT